MLTQSLSGEWNLSPVYEQITTQAHTLKDTEKPITQKNPAFGKNLKVTFPGDIHSALIKQKIIPDPYYKKNELDIQWVGQTDWITEREFKITKKFLKGQQFITLESADTFVKVFINDQEVGFCNNTFRFWRFNITYAIHEGINKIKLLFESSEKHAEEEAKKLPYSVPTSKYDVYSPHRNLVRRVQCQTGWDWGPCILTFGIYDSIQLEQTSTGFIDYIETKTYPDGDDWHIEVTTTYTAIIDSSIPISVCLTGNEIQPIITGTPARVVVGENKTIHHLTIQNPKLWYPTGCSPEDDKAIKSTGKALHKDNPLYNLSVTAGDCTRTKKIAFRTLKVVCKNDGKGSSFYFKVNGRPIYSKGSNWVPVDALPSRQTKERYESLLDSVIDANQNTLRVWGGGRYETDYFYELCDLKGILIFHDFMFACSLYPSNKEFLTNVREEVKHQVLRLKDHPSIALWCGNNENLGAINWYEESRNNRDRYLIDFDRLNEGVVGDEVRKNDPDRLWWPSSPCAGLNDFSDSWHSDQSGDMHYWSVWHERKPFEAYYSITPRFVSEFGYQSFPSYSEIMSFTDKENCNLTGPIMEFHQRSPNGNSIMIENFTRYFKFPKNQNEMLYLSQVQQALAIKTAVDYWRSLKPHCMGSIIWQLNDNWPVSSWASIEYSGKYKLLHYEQRKFFAPVSLSLYKKENKIYAYAINDSKEDLNVKFSLTPLDFDGNTKQELKASLLKQLDSLVPKDSSTLLFEYSIQDINTPLDEFFLYAELKLQGTVFPATLFLSEYKKCTLNDAKIEYSVIEKNESDTEFEIQLKAKKPAFFVSFDMGSIKGKFSDNMITMLQDKTYKISFTAEKQVSLAKIKKALVIQDLVNTY